MEWEWDYVFDGESGPTTLAELFGGHTQQVLYRLQYEPSCNAACPVNSSIGDCLNGLFPHLAACDVSLALVLTRIHRQADGLPATHGLGHPVVLRANNDFSTDLGAASTEEQMQTFLSGLA